MSEYPENDLEQAAFDRAATIPASVRLRNLTDAMVEDILNAPDEEILLEELSSRFEKLRSEREFLTAQLAGERKNIAGWIAARDANLARAEKAEAALRLILPMARGYAHEHPVGGNQEKVDHAASLLNGDA